MGHLPILPLILLPVLLVADLLHPGDGASVELLLNGDVAHGRGRRGAVPVLLPGRKPDHVAWPDLLDRPALALHPAATDSDDQRLAQRVRVPGSTGARLESDQGATDPRRLWRAEQRVDTHRSGEIV